MSQQAIDLEELTRLYDNRNQGSHDGMASWINAIGDDFPALRDELVRLNGIEEELGIEMLRANNAQTKANTLCAQLTESNNNLDEAKGLLEQLDSWMVCMPIAPPEDMCQSIPSFQKEISTFLASLAGTEEKQESCEWCNGTGNHGHCTEWACRDCNGTGKQPEQPTQGEVTIYFRSVSYGTIWRIHGGVAFCKSRGCDQFDGPVTHLPEVNLSADAFRQHPDWQEITAEEAGDAAPQEVDCPECGFDPPPGLPCTCKTAAQEGGIE